MIPQKEEKACLYPSAPTGFFLEEQSAVLALPGDKAQHSACTEGKAEQLSGTPNAWCECPSGPEGASHSGMHRIPGHSVPAHAKGLLLCGTLPAEPYLS